jgi:hypothetical protein
MGRKKTAGDFRQTSFRMPLAHYEALHQVADERGIDLAALLNEIVAEAVPGLERWLSERRAARTLRDYLSGLPGQLGPELLSLVESFAAAFEEVGPDVRMAEVLRSPAVQERIAKLDPARRKMMSEMIQLGAIVWGMRQFVGRHSPEGGQV